MIIDNNNSIKTNSPNNGRTGGATDSTRTDKATKTDNSAQADSVALSAEAHTMGRLRDAIDNASGIDSERVSNIQRAISEGRFEINPERLAEAMLAQDELLG